MSVMGSPRIRNGSVSLQDYQALQRMYQQASNANQSMTKEKKKQDKKMALINNQLKSIINELRTQRTNMNSQKVFAENSGQTLKALDLKARMEMVDQFIILVESKMLAIQ